MSSFTVKCDTCGKQKQFDDYSDGDEGGITIELSGSEDTLEDFIIECTCGSVIEFRRFG